MWRRAKDRMSASAQDDITLHPSICSLARRSPRTTRFTFSNPPMKTRCPAASLSLGNDYDAVSHKGSGGRGLQQTEETMNLITRFELATRSKSELQALYREVFGALVRSTSGSAERRNALASLENIQAEIRARDLEP